MERADTEAAVTTASSVTDSTASTLKSRSSSANPHILFSGLKDVFPVICSFLTLEDKLLSVIQVCKASNGCLSPLCFTTNPLGPRHSRSLARKIAVNRGAVALFSCVPSVDSDYLHDAYTLRMFTHLTSLSFDLRNTETAAAKREETFQSLLVDNPTFFNHLREISFPNGLPACELFSVASFPRLSSVIFTPRRDMHSRSMTTDQLQGLLNLLALPYLTSLEIQRGVWMDADFAAFLQHIPWTQLHRLSFKGFEGNVRFDALLNEQLSAAPVCSVHTFRLQGVFRSPQPGGLLPACALLFRSLITLDLTDLTIVNYPPTARHLAVISTHPQLSLPYLRHLLMPQCFRNDAAIYQATVRFVGSLAGQLTVLSCPVSSQWIFKHQPSIIDQVMSQATLLRNQTIHKQGLPEEHIDHLFAHAVNRGCPLPHLHTITLQNINVDYHTMEQLLSHLTQLVHFTIHCTVLSPLTLPLLGINCPLIRSIRIDADNASALHFPRFGAEEHKQRLSQCPFTPFSRLQMINLRATRSYEINYEPTYCTAGLVALTEMLHAAPLMFVSLYGKYVTCDQVLLFARFHSLQALEYSWDRRHAGLVARQPKYCIENPPSISASTPTITEEVLPAASLVEDRRNATFNFYTIFRQSVIPGHEYADRQGREAFFYDLQQHIQQGCKPRLCSK